MTYFHLFVQVDTQSNFLNKESKNLRYGQHEARLKKMAKSQNHVVNIMKIVF